MKARGGGANASSGRQNIRIPPEAIRKDEEEY